MWQCRICLAKNTLPLIYCTQSFVAECAEEITYLECYQFCTQLEATASHLSQTICSQCAAQMRGAYAFIQRAIKSNKILLTQAAPLIAKIEEESEQINVEAEIKELSKQKVVECFDVQEDEDEGVSKQEVVECFDVQDEEEGTFPVEQEIVDGNDKNNLDEFIEDWPILEKQESESSFKSKEPVREQKIKKQGNEIRCEICDLDFVTRTELRRHKKKGHKTILCDACPLMFSMMCHLRRHAITHEVRERNYACDVCGGKYYNQLDLNNHAKVHDKNRQPTFKCELCDKAYFHKRGLSLHMHDHTGRSVECGICSKKCAREAELKVHMRTHTGEKPFKCQYCERAFPKKCRLNTHERKHLNIRYKCDFCDKDFRCRTSLSEHRTSHTGHPFKCAICDKGCCSVYQTRKHIIRTHKIDASQDITKHVIQVKQKEFRGRIRNINAFVA